MAQYTKYLVNPDRRNITQAQRKQIPSKSSFPENVSHLENTSFHPDLFLVGTALLDERPLSVITRFVLVLSLQTGVYVSTQQSNAPRKQNNRKYNGAGGLTRVSEYGEFVIRDIHDALMAE